MAFNFITEMIFLLKSIKSPAALKKKMRPKGLWYNQTIMFLLLAYWPFISRWTGFFNITRDPVRLLGVFELLEIIPQKVSLFWQHQQFKPLISNPRTFGLSTCQLLRSMELVTNSKVECDFYAFHLVFYTGLENLPAAVFLSNRNLSVFQARLNSAP